MSVEHPVTCDERCYDLASWLLEAEPIEQCLFSHANANELGGVLEKAAKEWIANAMNNYDPTRE